MKWTKIFSLFLTLSLFVGIWSVIHAQKKAGTNQSPLTLAQILTGLQTQGVTAETRTLTARNQYIARRIRERGVTFSLTAQFESELRNAGASEELLKAIRENARPKPSSKATVPHSTMDFNKWREKAIMQAQKVAKLKQARYAATEEVLEHSKKRRSIGDDLAAKAKASRVDLLETTKKYREGLEGLLTALKESAQLETEAIEKKHKLIEQGLMFERDLEPYKQKLAGINSQIEDTNKRIAQSDQFRDEIINLDRLAQRSAFAREFAAIQKRFDPQINEALSQYVALLQAGQPSYSIMSASATLRPQILYQEKAKYTEAARQNRVQGTVIVSVVFTADGRIADARVIRSLPDGLDDEAIKAAREIVFLPALQDGKPVSVRISIEFTFNLI